LGASDAVHIAVNIPSSLELIVLNSNEEELEPKEEVEHEMDEEDEAFVD